MILHSYFSFLSKAESSTRKEKSPKDQDHTTENKRLIIAAVVRDESASDRRSNQASNTIEAQSHADIGADLVWFWCDKSQGGRHQGHYGSGREAVKGREDNYRS